MENPMPYKHIPCQQHPNRPLERVNADLSAQKTLYCVDCMFESDDPKGLYEKLPTIGRYVDSSAASFSIYRSQVKPVEQPPIEYLRVLSEQNQGVELLTQHIQNEKQKVQRYFEDLLKEIINLVDKERISYLKMLDDQVIKFRQNYAEFQKRLLKYYPRMEDINAFFPSKEDLEVWLNSTKNSAELEETIKEIQYNLDNKNSGLFLSYESEETKRQNLNTFVKRLKDMEIKQPLIDFQDLTGELLEEDFKPWLNLMLKEVLVLKNFISVVGQESPKPKQPVPTTTTTITKASIPHSTSTSSMLLDSTILSQSHLYQIEEWLPNGYQFDIKQLLYRGTRDGMIPKTFHEKCDDQGPTITFIKCQFEGSMKESIIGGFVDCSYHQKNTWISSEKAFIFSLTLSIKCPIVNKSFGALANPFTGPCFGNTDIYTHAIHPGNIFNETFIYPKSFANSNRLVESPKYKGIGKWHFRIIDIEVYAINEFSSIHKPENDVKITNLS